MSWNIATTESSLDTLRGDLTTAFDRAYDAPHPGVREQFNLLADAAHALAEAGVVGEAPFQVTLQGYVTQEDEPSTSDSAGLSVIGTVPAAEG